MRRLQIALVLLTLAFATAAPLGNATYGGGNDCTYDIWCPCPEYPHEVAYDGRTVAFNEGGQMMVVHRDVMGEQDMWIFLDEPSLTNTGNSLLSWFIYYETNGEPGIQRADPYCSECPPEHYRDGRCEPDLFVW